MAVFHPFRYLVLATIMFQLTSGFARAEGRSDAVLAGWYSLVLELVRHTPTYSPPVASRSFAYLGVTGFEAVASGADNLNSLVGQLNGLEALPRRTDGLVYDDAIVLHSALEYAVQQHFNNTGPTGQRAMAAIAAKLRDATYVNVAADVIERSEDHGKLLAEQVLLWSQNDGGAVIANMGFPLRFEIKKGPGDWQPSSLIRQQQFPLLPDWGNNRPFAMPLGTSCAIAPGVAFSEDPASAFFNEALEVVTVKKNLTPEQRAIARFWSDDPMLSPTPPGHWISIALQLFKRDKVDIEKQVDVLARLGIAEADAFIGCWQSKFTHNLLRPVTYIKKLIDPSWEPVLITPPFPEFPSGHSTQSGAAAVVLTEMFGENFAFEDDTHKKDGLPLRKFASFWAAAEEAGISRLYGGIHFRDAIERGLQQGRCIGSFTVKLKTRR